MTHSSPTDPNQAHSVGQPEEQLSSESLVPPEEQLTAPPTPADTPETVTQPATEVSASLWLVVAKNRRVNRDWEALLLRAPENARRCYEDLCNAPMVRRPKRVFPLKGKVYKGAWEYEVTSSERVFYVPDEENRKVLVYYAGKHPKSAPTPP